MAKPTVLEAFENSNLVITAHLASVDKIREKEREYDIRYIRSVTMIVDKVYKGDVLPGASLKFAQGGGSDCIWTYDEKWIGRKFLFYLNGPTIGPTFGEGMGSATFSPSDVSTSEPMFYLIGCGRSIGLEGAWDDLAYLDNRPKVERKTRLSGTFGVWFDYGFKSADIRIKIIGKNKTFTAKTNKDGFFEIYDLPPGDYDAQVELPSGWKINDYMVDKTSTGFDQSDPANMPKAANIIPVRIAPGRHAALDLIFDIDTAITGRVLSPSGKPMKGVCVMAVSTELAEGDHRGHSNCTDANGEFVIDEMRPGNYRLVANYDGKMNANAPFGAVFCPGVTDRAKASIIAVEPGRYVTGRLIQIPRMVELVTFRGKFLYSDGKPVVDDYVKFVPDDVKRYDDVTQKTDAAGNFEFQLPKGAKGKIFGEMYVYKQKFEYCFKLQELINMKSAGGNSNKLKSSVADVNSDEPSGLIAISFPFPFCKEAKD